MEVELPLFPRYIFCRFSASVIGKAIATQGVTRIVGFGGQPAEVRLEEIEAIQLLCQSSVLREPWAYIPDGTLVQVETGPLTGLRGIFYSSGDKRRLVISVTLLQRSVAVQLEDNTAISLPGDAKEAKKDNAIVSDKSDLALNLIKGSRNITA